MIEVLYSVGYFERTLFLLKKDDKYFSVYRSSGLNGGRKGRLIPFTCLLDRKPRFSEAMAGIITGYIFKEFFFEGKYEMHYKKMHLYPDVENFLGDLEVELKDVVPTVSFDNFDDISNIAKMINKEMKILSSGLEKFDWKMDIF